MLGELLEPYRGLFERRTHARRVVDARASVCLDGELGPVSCEMLDVSAGGSAVELSRPVELSPGEYAMLELPIPNGREPVRTRVKIVRYCRETGRVGVRFLDRSPAFCRQVADAAVAWESPAAARGVWQPSRARRATP